MKFGICLPIRRDTSIDFNIELGKQAEALGFDSIWASDHIVVPDCQLGRFSSVFYDPFVLLSAIASETIKIKLGTSAIILPYRNPVVVAKMISTLDNFSKGRVIFGVATGWLEDEFEALGATFGERGQRTNEYIEAIKILWDEDDPIYSGEFINFADIKFHPKPIQNPFPIWVGGNSFKAIERAAKYGSGWHPTWIAPDDLKEAIDDLKAMLKKSGKSEDDFVFSVRNRTIIGDDVSSKQDCYFKGSAYEIVDEINRYKDIGVNYIVFDPATNSDQETFELIHEISEKVLSSY